MSFRNSTLALTLAVAGACFAGSVAYASVFEGEQCSAHIMTGHPGINVSVPNGAVFRSLEEARNDALNRCSLTNLAWGAMCQTWCVPVGLQRIADQTYPRR
jgi:hypothetical protein